MIKMLTHEDVIRYAYNECNAEEADIIQAFIDTDKKLRQFYDRLTNTQRNLDSLNRQPSAEVIEKILNYSRKVDDLYSV